MDTLTFLELHAITLRLLLAAFLSGVIGYERELHGRAAGLRTTTLVGVGSCLIMITSIHMFTLFQGATDPSRIAAQVVSGIGFLGAGTILRHQASVVGLTTAAAIWAVSGVGLAVGCGFYEAAVMATAVIFTVLASLSHLERRMKKQIEKTLTVQTSGGLAHLSQIMNSLAAYHVQMKHVDISPCGTNLFAITLRMDLPGNAATYNHIIQSLLKIEGISSVQWL